MNHSPFSPPPRTPFTVLSLGAGVQSSTLALMAARGEIGPMPDFAVFADTQSEPASVMKWLDWLETQLPFPLYRVTQGSLAQRVLEMKVTEDGRKFSKADIPIFTLSAKNEIGKVRNRNCTRDYKIFPVLRKIRQLALVKHGQKEVTVTQWIGISWDEMHRMKDSRVKWARNRWPLVELRMTRRQCLDWMKAQGYPEPPKSACWFCPYHSDNEWRRLRDHEPEEFAKAIAFERALQAAKASTTNLASTPFLHKSCLPLDQVDLTTDTERGQLDLWQEECDGMCGT